MSPATIEPSSVDTPADVRVVRAFLAALARADVDAAAEYLHPEIAWHNVSLPILRGYPTVTRVLRQLARPGLRFDVIVHHAAGENGVVLTERTDLLGAGPVNAEFWVCGTFELRDGRIAVWRDYFSVRDVIRGIVVGVARAVTGRRGGRGTGYLSEAAALDA
ncbi:MULTISPECIES: limonene-1,2-epoxide hydrolase family protein [Rhodococcus]|jgi:limonene-1,2-epoxide hydrolase|uniref:limonene-1,2-epoxide hydrolase family protein n=1 Tax=Rhodococcus TaxID=1827 RepID=UPI001AE7F719|nr:MULTISPECIES: limonene-1,2-epoxide hydrolase family protein [Rhodococcus]MBP1160170.1 limonene-1,2-epoxide hydrolase [Rhodococcus sp. PvR099]MCZ4557188.1 nuclear transport factor 2 family protein [Rhodococcus maanshanensis]